MRAMLTRDDDYLRAARRRACRRRRRCRRTCSSRSTPTPSASARARGSSVFALSEHGATSAAAKWLAQKENAADLIGGVNLDARDPVLARTLIDLSQTRADQRQPQGRPAGAGRHRHDQSAAQGGGRAGGIRGAEGARHPVDPGRDRVHLESGRGAEAAQRSTPDAASRSRCTTASAATSRPNPPLARERADGERLEASRLRTRTRPASGSCQSGEALRHAEQEVPRSRRSPRRPPSADLAEDRRARAGGSARRSGRNVIPACPCRRSPARRNRALPASGSSTCHW